jgi:hypothetical protein
MLVEKKNRENGITRVSKLKRKKKKKERGYNQLLLGL